jgi:hypothetical protein
MNKDLHAETDIRILKLKSLIQRVVDLIEKGFRVPAILMSSTLE